jgi:hypothetical protein
MWLIISLAFIITLTMALYGCLSNLMYKSGDAPRAIGLGMGSIFGLLSVYMWCSEAQRVEDCVSMICIILKKKQRVVKIFRCPIKPVLQVH